MSASLARRERADLCDLALVLGEDAPTLCGGWDAKDLVTHLLVRERRPIGASGIMVAASPRDGRLVPFTLCLDVTLRVAAVPSSAAAAARLQADFTELARDPHHWAFRYVRAECDADELVVRALLLEPIEDLYGADHASPGDVAASDVVLRLLNAHSEGWRELEVGDRPMRAQCHRVRRRYWTRPS
jgi:hypothetical protein